MKYIYHDIASFDSSELRGLYNNDNLLISYLSEEEVKEKHNLYMYIEMLDNGQIAVKFGKTKDSIYIRYKGEQNLIKNYNFGGKKSENLFSNWWSWFYRIKLYSLHD